MSVRREPATSSLGAFSPGKVGVVVGGVAVTQEARPDLDVRDGVRRFVERERRRQVKGRVEVEREHAPPADADQHAGEVSDRPERTVPVLATKADEPLLGPSPGREADDGADPVEPGLPHDGRLSIDHGLLRCLLDDHGLGAPRRVDRDDDGRSRWRRGAGLEGHLRLKLAAQAELL